VDGSVLPACLSRLVDKRIVLTELIKCDYYAKGNANELNTLLHIPPCLPHRTRGCIMKNPKSAFAKTCAALLLGFGAMAVNAQPLPDFELEMFQITKDTRTCAAPACGGVFMTPLNGEQATCPDGTVSRRCYVGSVDISFSNYDVLPFDFSKGAPVKIWAAYDRGDTSSPANYGKLSVRTSLLPIGTSSASATRQIYNTDLPRNEFGEPIPGCTIADGTPCLKYVLSKVNKADLQQLTASSFDFSKLAMTDKQIAQFARYVKLGAEPVLIKPGDAKTTTSTTGVTETRLTVEALFLPVEFFVDFAK
jgi:hypothetical protein